MSGLVNNFASQTTRTQDSNTVDLKIDHHFTQNDAAFVRYSYNGVTTFTRNILFDEKIGGTVHLALGTAYPESGGLNRSGLHWDMICDLSSGSEIYADGDLVYRDGRFLNGIW